MLITRRICYLALGITLIYPAVSTAADVSFQRDVMAVLSKAGCNMGVCHGNQYGKGGFKLSLRGQDPEIDYETLTRDQSGRRVNRLDSARSLVLLKPTMQVAHEGGRRFDVDSPEYKILEQWIASGLSNDAESNPKLVGVEVTPDDAVVVEPQTDVALRVLARFEDGTERDVTQLTVYSSDNDLAEISPNGIVRRRELGETTIIARYLDKQSPIRIAFIAERADFAWSNPEPANVVDELVFEKLQRLQINPSEVCDDTVFIRRVYLDLLGLIPTADESRLFVADSSPDKRSNLIDGLLQRPEFADFWALKWSDLLRNEEKTLDRKGVQNFHAWIRKNIDDGRPINDFVHDLIAARGSTYAEPAANYYRAMRDSLTRAESTAQLFLGVRLQCAKCHNHPFDQWTQDDYYGWANLFSRVQYKVLENRRRDTNDSHEFDGEQIVYMAAGKEPVNPRTGKPQQPQFLSDSQESPPKDADRLESLADWLTSPDNPRFAANQVNRIWFHLMGRGIVDPIDDFRDTNPPANPALLDALAEQFVRGNYDLRATVRLIANSKTYQLSSEPNESNVDDERNFSHASVRRLSAEQFLDSATQVLGVPVPFNGFPLGMRAGQIPGVNAIRDRDQPPSVGDQFLKAFGKPERLQTCECERSDETTLNQAFQLVSGPLLNNLVSDDKNCLSKALQTAATNDELVTELYWSALSRAPNGDELRVTAAYLQNAKGRRRAVEDLVWSLLNSQEFLLRR